MGAKYADHSSEVIFGMTAWGHGVHVLEPEYMLISLPVLWILVNERAKSLQILLSGLSLYMFREDGVFSRTLLHDRRQSPAEAIKYITY